MQEWFDSGIAISLDSDAYKEYEEGGHGVHSTQDSQGENINNVCARLPKGLGPLVHGCISVLVATRSYTSFSFSEYSTDLSTQLLSLLPPDLDINTRTIRWSRLRTSPANVFCGDAGPLKERVWCSFFHRDFFRSHRGANAPCESMESHQ